MNLKNLRIESLIIAVGFAVVGMFIGQGLKQFSTDNRVVTVKGLAQMEVDADLVTWPLVYKELSNNLPALYNTLNSKNSMVVKFLLDNGLDSADISINAPQILDLKAEQYGTQDVKERYNATSVITVKSDRVKKVREIMTQQSELLKEGIAIITSDYSYRVDYDFTGLNDIKPKMIQEATANAREAAQKFAEDSDSKLGKIKRAYQGQFSITNRDDYTPYIKTVRVVNTVDYFLED